MAFHKNSLTTCYCKHSTHEAYLQYKHWHRWLSHSCCLYSYSGMTAIATYLLTKEIWNSGAGLFAACFIAVGELILSDVGFYTVTLVLAVIHFPDLRGANSTNVISFLSMWHTGSQLNDWMHLLSVFLQTHIIYLYILQKVRLLVIIPGVFLVNSWILICLFLLYSVLRLIHCGCHYIQSCRYSYHVRFRWIWNHGLFPHISAT